MAGDIIISVPYRRNPEALMRSVRFIFPLFLLFALPVWGQDGYPKGEVFGGYAFSHTTVDTIGRNLNGWGTSVSGSFSRHLGLTADFSGVYGSEPYPRVCTDPVPPGCPAETENVSAYHFLAGPRFTLRIHRVTPFAQALFGVKDLRQEKSGNWTTFAMGFGGGVDIPLGKDVTYRIFQADYLPARRPLDLGGWDSDLRLQTGIVFTFGGKKR